MSMEILDKLRKESIDSLMKENTVNSWAEAILICLISLKDKDGKLIGRVKLSDDHQENIDYCRQIAKMLRGE